jgi:hypothetical protein
MAHRLPAHAAAFAHRTRDRVRDGPRGGYVTNNTPVLVGLVVAYLVALGVVGIRLFDPALATNLFGTF